MHLCETNWQCVFDVTPCGSGRAKVNVENAFGAHVSCVILSLELPHSICKRSGPRESCLPRRDQDS